MWSVLQDVRYALRHLRRSPGFTLAAVLTLAVGIGATTAVFSIVEGVLLRPLPFPGQSRLVALADIVEGVDYDGDTPGVTAPGTRIYMRDTNAFSSLGSYQPTTYELSGFGDPMQIAAARLSAGVFPVLAVPPLVGRVFTQREDDSSVPVTVLSYQMWRSRFQGDASVVGKKILLDRKPYIRTLFFSVTVVLFIACANLAGLLLLRVTRRSREVSVRLALGASGAAVMRQSLVEVLVLSVGGGLAGLGLAWVALRAGVSFLPETLPRVSSIGMDGQVVAFAFGLVAATALLCGLIPALAAARTNVNEALKEGGRTGSAGSGYARLRSVLVIAELAVALVLLTCSGLLLRSFEKVRSVNLGLRTDHLLTAHYSLPRQQYGTQAAMDAFNLSLLSKLQALAGVRAVGVTSLLPVAGQDVRATFTPEGYIPPPASGLNLAWATEVMGDYFRAAGIPLLRGRAFSPDDDAHAPLVAIVNHTLAHHYWPGQDPIGKRLHRGPTEATTVPWVTVVGEIGDVKELAADVPATNQVYFPFSQAKADAGSFAPPDMLTGRGGSVVLRSSELPEQMVGALRHVVGSLDPQLPLTQVESMAAVVEEGQAPRRFNTALIASFAAAAVLLALLGIYSVIAYSAVQRTQEMAIRLALGSQRSGVMRLILSSSAKLGLLGCAIGGLVAVFATRFLRSLLFEVDPLDPAVIVLAALSIFLLALAASMIPAYRAACVEPVDALRDQ
jgi:predicted permease